MANADIADIQYFVQAAGVPEVIRHDSQQVGLFVACCVAI